MHSGRPHCVRQVENMSPIQQQEREVPRQDVHSAEVQAGPQGEQQHSHTQHGTHHQAREPEVVRHQEGQEADEVRYLSSEVIVFKSV